MKYLDNAHLLFLFSIITSIVYATVLNKNFIKSLGDKKLFFSSIYLTLIIYKPQKILTIHFYFMKITNITIVWKYISINIMRRMLTIYVYHMNKYKSWLNNNMKTFQNIPDIPNIPSATSYTDSTRNDKIFLILKYF